MTTNPIAPVELSEEIERLTYNQRGQRCMSLLAENARLRAALERSLNWLASYPGGLAATTYAEARAALAGRGGQ